MYKARLVVVFETPTVNLTLEDHNDDLTLVASVIVTDSSAVEESNNIAANIGVFSLRLDTASTTDITVEYTVKGTAS